MADVLTAPAPVPAAAGPPGSAAGQRGGPRARPGRWRRVRAALPAVLRSVAVIGALAALWEVAPRLGWVEPSLIPPLSQVGEAWWALAQSGQLWDNTQASLRRAVVGFALAVAVGVPVGIVIGWYRWAHQLLDPLLELFRNTAALALLPVFTLLLGIGETSKTAIVVYACLFPVLLNTISGVGSVDPLLIKATRSLGLGPLALFRKVVVPAALPTIFTGIRLAGAASILVLIAAEMVGAKAGLGYLVNYAQFNFMIPQMYAGILTISALGLLANASLVRLERRSSRWRTDVRG